MKTTKVGRTTKEEVKLRAKRAYNKEYYERKKKELDIDVPVHARGGRWKWNFESENMSSELAIMWILAGLCILFALFAMHGDQQALNAGLIH